MGITQIPEELQDLIDWAEVRPLPLWCLPENKRHHDL